MYVDLRNIKRGEVLNVVLDGKGCEQGGERPVVVIQNNIGNTYSPTIIVACITSQLTKAKLPTHVELDKERYGLKHDSIVLCEQIRTLDKRFRVKERITMLDEFTMIKISRALCVSLDLEEKENNVVIKPNENPLDKLNEEVREQVEYLLGRLYFYDDLINNSRNEDVKKHMVNDRDSIAYKFKRICKTNNLNHEELYKNIKVKVAISI